MSKVKILVAQHKPAKVYSNDIYTPIHVGKAISTSDLGILGDATGENISHLNPYYCELTAQYWAWKNLHDVDYIGLCHYRRYFKTEITEENIDAIMSDCDIILTRRITLRTNILHWYSSCLIPEDIALFHLYMSKLYNNVLDVYHNYYLKRNWINPANMFICAKDLFNDFCAWQFGILNDLFTIIPKSPYSRERRLMGYLGESLLPFYAFLKGLKIKEIPIVAMIGDKDEYNKHKYLHEVKNKLLFTKGEKNYNVPEDIINGLKNDGLLQKLNELFANKINKQQ